MKRSSSTLQLNLLTQWYPAQNDFLECEAPYKSFCAGIGCLDGSTLISGVPVAELSDPIVVRTLSGDSLSSPSYRKGKSDLFRVRTQSGRTVVVTAAHRFLTPAGWLPLSRLAVGSLIAADGSEDGQKDLERSIDSPGHYSFHFHPCDVLPSPLEVHVANIEQQYAGPACNSCGPIHYDLPSIDYSSHRALCFRKKSDREFPFYPSECELPLNKPRNISPNLWLTHQQDISLLYPEDVICEDYYSLYRCKCHKFVEFWKSSFGGHQESPQFCVDCASCAISLRLLDSYTSWFSYPYANDLWDEIQDIQWNKRGEFYDLHVPGSNHYSANGLWHHNSGKTVCGAVDLLRRAEPDRKYLVIAPTYPLVLDVALDVFVAEAKRMGMVKESNIRRSAPPSLVLNNGARVLFRSATEPDRLRGLTLSGIWMDEASLMKEEVYDICLGRLREKRGRGWLTATFTPKGTSHWTYKVFAAPSVDRSTHQIFRGRTKDNPFVSEARYKDLVAKYTTLQAEQELEGQFLDTFGGLFRRAWFEIVDYPVGTPQKFVRAWDFSATPDTPEKAERKKDDPDYTVGTLIARSDIGVYYILSVVRGRWSPSEVEKIVKQTAQTDATITGNTTDIWVEQEPGSAGVYVVEHIMRNVLKGYRYHSERPTGPKSFRAHPLAAAAEQGKVKLLHGDWNAAFLDELAEFPMGSHDDIVDSASMAFSKVEIKQEFWFR